MTLFASHLPDFPWDTLAAVRQRAAAHRDGLIDLSIGTPVDPTPRLAQEALAGSANAPGYPPTVGSAELRAAIREWFARRRGATVTAVLPTLGSKEAVALLPSFLGIGPGESVVHPAIAYPTYDVGARLAGASPQPGSADPTTWPATTRLVWLNSPANPHGHVLSRDELRTAVAAARTRGIVLASDECYAEFTFGQSDPAPSLLADDVTDGDHTGLLTLYSLSKQSNLAGYRAAFMAGDPHLIDALTQVRKHCGFMVPAPVATAMCALLGDETHVAVQRERYARRRAHLADALRTAGYTLDERCLAGMYLWVSREGASGRDILEELADRGILVAPGDFYGPAGAAHVRVALSATDTQIAQAARRLRAESPH
ncbi:MAG: succinyldiaminopimelate transaminase [Bowdeniella nasicola]|nr:succinyldiaminopimelate transaminase [Bowdeniella nasicola]